MTSLQRFEDEVARYIKGKAASKVLPEPKHLPTAPLQ